MCVCAARAEIFHTPSSSQEVASSEVIVSSSSSSSGRQVVPGSQQLHFNQETMVKLDFFFPPRCATGGSRTRMR